LEKVFDSKEFKENFKMSEEKIKALKDNFASPEFREKYGKINKFYLNGKDIFSDSEELKKIAKQYSGNGYSFYNGTSNFSKKELTKKEKRKLEKLNKERAEAEKKLREIRKEQRELQGNPWIVSVDAHAPKVSYSATSSYTETPMPLKSKMLSNGATFKTNVKDMIDANSDGDLKIFIDGKASSKEDMQNLNSSKIESINITKNNNAGKKEGEIYIKTRK